MALYNGKQLIAFCNYVLKNAGIQEEVGHDLVENFRDSQEEPIYCAAFQPGEDVMVSFCKEMNHWGAKVHKVHVFMHCHSYDLDVTMPSSEVVRFHNVHTSFVYKKGATYVNNPIGS